MKNDLTTNRCVCHQCGAKHLKRKRPSPILSPPRKSSVGLLYNLYLIQSQPSGYVKIGVSTNVEKRLRTLQGSNPEHLTIIKTVHGCAQYTERKLHKYFQQYRLRGEWFSKDVLMDELEITTILQALK